ncbi:Thioredoxin, mitochondrial [Schistosoma japonicum]|nr:Thioredoxin, mitochondrial [Schistosoma japonicum]KAH8861700.1 Thioredoxin, mitochondrial [Schistosoma japonicum]KAH8861701.1 Thioredoxin, mitochondrial [Schistosoma japonicum]KAH8861702.1 Thioredoxin, mitochondrial [Schistosoma japonicum]
MLESPSIRILQRTVGSSFLSKQIPFSRFFSNVTKINPEYGVTNIQDDIDFRKRVLENPAPVLVDFHAKWCGPCKILGPRLENVMKSYMNSVLLAKVDVDQLDTVAEKYKISVVPTVISIKNGKEIERFQGAKEEEFIRRKIEYMLAHNG